LTAAMPEVVVVGGGPAGTAIATRLARLGHAVLLLDRDRFPRPKPCGDCVNPAAVRELADLGVLADVLAEPHTPLEGWTIVPPSGEAAAFRGSFPIGCPGIAIGRERLDRVLLEHARAAGVQIRTASKVTDLVRNGKGAVGGVQVAGQAEIHSRLVVGADGLRSVVLRRLGLVRRAPRLRKLALTAHVTRVPSLDRRGELHVLPWGTVGIAPIGDGEANVTVVVTGAATAEVARGRETYYDSVLASTAPLERAMRCGKVLATGPFDWPTRSAVADGALLVGDAAGYYDPFTGQGIYRALRGAALAAGVAHAALQAGDLSARCLRPYDRAHRRAFGPASGLQWVIEQFTSRGSLMGVAAARLRRHPELADALVAVTGDLLPVRTLLRPRTLVSLFS
jgi:menaquinone-9 beta-reductase